MKTGKKLLALLLAVVMTMSLLTVGAFAEETPSSETPLEQQDSGSGNIPEDPAEGPADDLTGNSGWGRRRVRRSPDGGRHFVCGRGRRSAV